MRTSLIRKEASEWVLWLSDWKGLLTPARMTIGWVEEFVRDGEVVDGFSEGKKETRPLSGESSLAQTCLLISATVATIATCTIATRRLLWD